MIPSKIKIENFAKRCHMGTLGGKGLRRTLTEESAIKACRSIQAFTQQVVDARSGYID